MKSNQYTKAVYWDNDGVINDLTRAVAGDCISLESLANNECYITDKNILKTVLEVLDENGVLSVSSSQRLILPEAFPPMFDSFDEAFGKERPYLKKTYVLSEFKLENLSTDKTPLIEALQSEYKELKTISIQNSCIVDDKEEIINSAKDKGYLTVLVKRSSDTREAQIPPVGTDQDRKHLAEIFVKLFSPAEIFNKIIPDLMRHGQVNRCEEDVRHLSVLMFKQVIPTYFPELASHQDFNVFDFDPKDIYKIKSFIRKNSNNDNSQEYELILSFIKNQMAEKKGFITRQLFNFKYWYNNQSAGVKVVVFAGLFLLVTAALAGLMYGGFVAAASLATIAGVAFTLPQVSAFLMTAFTVAANWFKGVLLSMVGAVGLFAIGKTIDHKLSPSHPTQDSTLQMRKTLFGLQPIQREQKKKQESKGESSTITVSEGPSSSSLLEDKKSNASSPANNSLGSGGSPKP